MNIIKTRSPYFISIDEALQTGGKVELFLWHKDETEPVTANYTLSKSIPSLTQRKLDWNISNYINDFIEIINPIKIQIATIENNDAWCFCKVKRYKLIDTTYTLLDTINYVGVQGFTKYTDGTQIADISEIRILKNKNINSNYNNAIPEETPYINVLIDKIELGILNATYQRIDGLAYTVVQNLLLSQSGIFNLKVPLTLNPIDGNFVNGCKLTLSYATIADPIINIFYTYPIDECKYTPVECTFINSFGGWEFLTFYKAQTNAINVKGSDYNLLPDAVDYNIYKGQSKVFNINGSQTVKLNTGWVTENYNELIRDLLLSEVVLLDNKPVKVKTQSLTYKTQLKDKMINFELDFEYAFDLINNVI